jgi:hypothetical protein
VTQEYEQLREALLALLCVGDKINQICYDSIANYAIMEQRISMILKNTVKLERYNWIMFKFNTIEQHEGELYIWSSDHGKFHYRSDQRLKKIIEIIESKQTRRV